MLTLCTYPQRKGTGAESQQHCSEGRMVLEWVRLGSPGGRQQPAHRLHAHQHMHISICDVRNGSHIGLLSGIMYFIKYICKSFLNCKATSVLHPGAINPRVTLCISPFLTNKQNISGKRHEFDRYRQLSSGLFVHKKYLISYYI